MVFQQIEFFPRSLVHEMAIATRHKLRHLPECVCGITDHVIFHHQCACSTLQTCLTDRTKDGLQNCRIYLISTLNNMEYFQGKEILNILIIFCLQVQHDNWRVSGKTCILSLQSLQKVDQCPRNALEWDARAALFNCSSINQTCVPPDMFLYHCVLNADGSELLEVCAPLRFIHGQKCTEFDSGGPIIQESANTCGNATVPCPQVYNSKEAFKYQSCYDRVKIRAKPDITTKPTNSRSENLHTVFVASALLTFNVVLALGIVYCFVRWHKSKHMRRKNITVKYLSENHHKEESREFV